MVPEFSVVVEGAEELLTHFDDFLMGERFATLKTMEGVGDADRVVKHPERIHQGVETQTTANRAHLVGEAGTQEEDAVAVGDGLG